MKETREKILNAAVRVFSRNGFHQAKMDDIAETAGVSKGTLYYNFESKSLLFSATVTEGMEAVMGEIRTSLKSDLPFIDHFRKLIDINVDRYIRYSDLAQIVFNEVSSGIDESVLRNIEEVRGRFIDLVAEELEAGQADNRIRPCNTRLAAVAIVGMMDNLCNLLVRYPGSVDRGEITDFLFSFLAAGLLTRSEADKAKGRIPDPPMKEKA
ncbi:MAG: TetR/AcrR family transcriptional regulator [Deltaproteobacteria bacterium]|uniref:TetR/AcrR family transcriptional regulator n=1 Tax=Candidatus Zymogenus saltonus TaxID=2844893 RepID=A0A9D8KFZ8_9DELT|nr:TetR/AcrR family transcriptional regulator [Candidatus Zymogenus saltonus]